MAKPMDFMLRFSSDTKGVNGIEKVASALGDVKASAADASKAIDGMSDVKIKVNAEAIDNARKRIRELQTQISDLKTIDIDYDTTQAEREIRRLQSTIRTLDVDPFKNLGSDARRAAREAERALNDIDVRFDSNRAFGDFKNDARQSGTEAAASFQGGFGSLTDFGQEVAAEAFAAFGPAGAAAGIAAAIGLGFITTKLTEIKEQTKQLKTDLTNLDIEGELTPKTRTKTVLDQLRESGDLADLAKDATAAGVSFGELALAIAEGPNAVLVLARKIKDSTSQFDFSSQSLVGNLQRTADAMIKAEGEAALFGEAMKLAGDDVEIVGEKVIEVNRLEIRNKSFKITPNDSEVYEKFRAMERAPLGPKVIKITADPSPAYAKFRQMERDFANVTTTVTTRRRVAGVDSVGGRSLSPNQINLVRVNIAGREVQAVVDDVNARSRSSEMLADLMGVGA